MSYASEDMTIFEAASYYGGGNAQGRSKLKSVMILKLFSASSLV